MHYLLRINYKALGVPEKEPLPCGTPWELFARCDTQSDETCYLFQQIGELARKDQRAALSALHKLVQVAASGQPITNFYDKKQCHEIHGFTYKGKGRSVWRIWKGYVTRITFYYGEGRAILLTNAFAKYEDKLSRAQKIMLEKEVIAYIEAADSKKLFHFEKTDD